MQGFILSTTTSSQIHRCRSESLRPLASKFNKIYIVVVKALGFFPQSVVKFNIIVYKVSVVLFKSLVIFSIVSCKILGCLLILFFRFNIVFCKAFGILIRNWVKLNIIVEEYRASYHKFRSDSTLLLAMF